MKREDRSLRVKIYMMLGVYVLFVLLLAVRAFQHQVINREEYLKWARDQQLQPVKLVPLRGKIVDRRGNLLAVSLKAGSLFAHPAQVQNPERTAQILAQNLGLDAGQLLEKLKQPVSFVWLARQLPIDEAEKVKRLALPGIGVEREGRRYYPFRELAANVIGFAGVDSQGLEGVEIFREAVLKGKQGRLLLQQDARGRLLWQELYQDSREDSVKEVVLTLDVRIQHFAEEALRKAIEENGAVGGTVVVMDVNRGDLLALASLPTFNPNRFSTYPPELRRNRAITDAFEPGSTAKPFALAAALEEGLLNEEVRFNCERGKYFFGGHWIHDIHPYDVLTLREVIVKSSNIGTAKVAEILGSQILWKYLDAFGFGKKTGVDLPGEATGTLRHWKSWTTICLANHAFGQGFSVTALQLACAYAALANGGRLVEPHVVHEIRDEKGTVLEAWKPGPERRVISARTSERVRAVLEGVVEEGTGKRAKLAGFRVGGKTGTAQKFEPALGIYSPNKMVCSFVGIVPIDKPEIVMVVAIDEPRGRVTGGMVAAPVFQQVASKALFYRNVDANVPEPASSASVQAELFRAAPAAWDLTEPAAAAPVASQGAVRPDPSLSTLIMPELRRRTVRMALRELEGLPVEVRLEGSGVVIEQDPKPGSLLETGQLVKLTARALGPDG
jgi:cell division protein FtsI (penicillin-binding protein 3)